jgi:hypothetical protein
VRRLARCVARFAIGAQVALGQIEVLATAGPALAAPPEPAPAAESPAPGASSEPPAATESQVPPGAVVPNPPAYEYPVYPVGHESSVDWFPPDGWRYPALVGDVLLVRPLMVVSLIGGGALFVATLPISAATCTTRDWIHTLQDQYAYTFQRPLGAF